MSTDDDDLDTKTQQTPGGVKARSTSWLTEHSPEASVEDEIVESGPAPHRNGQLSSPEADLDIESDDVIQRPKKRLRSKGASERTRARNGRGRTRKSRSDSSSSPEADTLPEYLQSRRSLFESRRASLLEAGLMLPPSYEDLEFSDDERLSRLAEKPILSGTRPPAPYRDVQLPLSMGLIPASIAQYLREYQVEGVAFLHKHFVFQTGCILGDDMGLGKTVQVIAFLTAAFGKTGDERDAKRMRKARRAGMAWYPRVLIVCPGTLIDNWLSELKRWGWWHVEVCHGANKTQALQAAAAGRLEIMMTTYATYRGQQSAMNCIEWDCIIADECHNIKGHDNDTTKALNGINALCRIGLTGTAIQNDYLEFWTLLNWTNIGQFGSKSEWNANISQILKAGQSHAATLHQLGRARDTADALVTKVLPPFFLRRLKSLIASQLPKKVDRIVFCPLTKLQSEVYTNLLDSPVISDIKKALIRGAEARAKEKGKMSRPETASRESRKLQPPSSKAPSRESSGDQELDGPSLCVADIFPSIIILQKVCNHIALLLPNSADPKMKQERDLGWLKMAMPDQWREMYSHRDSLLNFANVEFCGKWKVLRKLLKFWHEAGDKVLVFSRSVRLLRMLRMLFQSTSYNLSYLDGAMSYEERSREVDEFNNDPRQFVFLISSRAGGVGLNITAANKVVIFDPDWNPAIDLQAQDRAYRIGQSRDVEVFRLITFRTIEEVVYARQIYKQQQAAIGYTASKERRYFRGVQHSLEEKGEIFGLLNLFAEPDVQTALRDIVKNTNVAESKAGVDILKADVHFASDVNPARPTDDHSIKTEEPDDKTALSQLAALIEADDTTGLSSGVGASKRSASRTSESSDPVLAILASAGVSYTHQNAEVIGSSRIEGQLSRHAIANRNDVQQGDQTVFPPEDNTSYAAGAVRHRDFGRWVYNPPLDVRVRQFCSMAKFFGHEDPVAFGHIVEKWTPGERRERLDEFYRMRVQALGSEART